MKSKFHKIVNAYLSNLSTDQLLNLLEWATRAHKIVTSTNESKRQKIQDLKKLSKDKNFKNSVKTFFQNLPQTLWKDRSLPSKLGIVGAASGLVLGPGAGIAAMGTAVGVPLFLVTAAGGTLLGTIIAEIQLKLKNSKQEDVSEKKVVNQ